MRLFRSMFSSLRRSSVPVLIIVVLLFFNSIFILSLRSHEVTATTKALLKNNTTTVKDFPTEKADSAENQEPLMVTVGFPEVPPIQENMIKFIHEPSKFCHNSTSPQILIVVHSSVDNFKNREILRRTLGKYDKYNGLETRVMFVTGRSNSKALMLKLNNETSTHGDILTISVVDKYTRLVYKAVGWMKWVVSACEDIQNVVKIDDDTFLHMFKLSEMFTTCQNNSKAPEPICSKMSCLLWKNFQPHRKGKYSLSLSEYSSKSFPPFCPGVAIFIPGGLVSRLLEASRHVQFLWLDDVYLTGLLMNYLGESHYNFGHKITNTLLKNYKRLDVGKMFVGHFKNDVINGVYEKHWKVIETKASKKT